MFWLTAGAAALTAASFGVGMFAFFRPRPGSAPLRLLLLASVWAATATLGASIAGRTSVGATGSAVGLALLAGANGLYWWAVAAHRGGRPSAAFATQPPAALVTSGPYRFVRHPFYLAYLLGFSGAAALAGVWWAWAFPVWLAAVYGVAARQEEQVILAGPLGEDYRQYRRRVGGFAPRCCRGHPAGDRSRRPGGA